DSSLARTVTWSSANASVATVDQTGLVTAVGAGSTSITARSTVDTNVTGGASITVSPASTVTPASVRISAITHGPCPNCLGGPPAPIGSPVDLTNVQGQVNVTVNYDPGSTTVKSAAVTLVPTGSSLGTTQTCGTINVGSASSSQKPAAGAVSQLVF